MMGANSARTGALVYTPMLSFYKVKSYEFQHRPVCRSFGGRILSFGYLTCMCVFSFKLYIFLVHGTTLPNMRCCHASACSSLNASPLTPTH